MFIALASLNAQSFTQFDDRQTTDIGNIRLGMTNYGVIGNANRYFQNGVPSCEYPKGSGIEHLFNGGLWIGAIQQGQIKVTTAANVETGNSNGDPSARDYEFSATSGVSTRSSLLNSAVFDPRAISHQDFLAEMTDSLIFRPISNAQIANHNPLKVQVRFAGYSWNFVFADMFVILNYTIINRSSDSLTQLHAGMFTNAVVRNNRVTPPGSGGTNYYNKGAGGFIDSLYALYKYDKAGEPDRTQSYFSVRYLGGIFQNDLYNPAIRSGFNVNYQSWQFTGTQLPRPINDFERFDRMRTTIGPSSSLRALISGVADNRVELIAAGPFPSLAPGDSVTVSFAIVCARATGGVNEYINDSTSAKTTLIQNLALAQQTFNGEDRNSNGVLDLGEDLNNNGRLDRFILPSPPPIPRFRVVPEDKKVTLYWDNSAETAIDPLSNLRDFEGYRIYRTNAGDDFRDGLSLSLRFTSQFDISGNRIGFDNGFNSIRLPSPIQFNGDTTKYVYRYIFDNLLNGWQYGFSVTSFDSGNGSIGLAPLESAPLANLVAAFPGKIAVADGNTETKIGVYPNPYYSKALWDGSGTRDRKIYFTNLPEECEITVFTVAGDIIDRFTFNSRTYAGGQTSWNRKFGNQANTKAYSGGEVAWDFISRSDQAISSGLYVVSVRNLRSGEIKTARFAVVK
ncbi:MAG: hypothetical protein SFU91_08215 [Chloroherpetonaceae bacterium]|nr:hypothetical protein [Chloroherpetonaceae bacterium]